MGVPIGFVQGESGYMLAAIQGLAKDTNLFVADNGAWRGRYIPVVYRCYPFHLAAGADGENIFCIDEELGQVSDGSDNEPFFDADDELTPKLKGILESLSQYKGGRATANNISNLLHQEGLLEPWPIQVEGAEGLRVVSGIFRVNEPKLNQLSAIALKKVRDAGALSVAYCQLLSMTHIGGLQILAKAADTVPVGSSELDFGEFSDGGSISFDNL